MKMVDNLCDNYPEFDDFVTNQTKPIEKYLLNPIQRYHISPYLKKKYTLP